MMLKYWLPAPLVLAVALVMLASTRQGAAGQSPASSSMFRDITRDAGITFQHHAAPEKNTSSNR